MGIPHTTDTKRNVENSSKSSVRCTRVIMGGVAVILALNLYSAIIVFSNTHTHTSQPHLTSFYNTPPMTTNNTNNNHSFKSSEVFKNIHNRVNTRRVLTAYLEDPKLTSSNSKATPRLQPRLTSADNLDKVAFPNVTSCSKLAAQWPIDDPFDYFTPQNNADGVDRYSYFINRDPFLPWIHDVFPSADGSKIEIVAQNKRRCHTGDDYKDLMKEMRPQIALYQSVAVKRMHMNDNTTRYRLASHEEADSDADDTRFICRFSSDLIDQVYETLSIFRFNYEVATRYKGYQAMYKDEGKENGQFWTSTLQFDCPVPAELQQIVRDGSSIIDDYASIYLDIIPIRTPARPQDSFIPPRLNPDGRWGRDFDAIKEWGGSYLLPKIIDSGRWENIPICKSPLLNAASISSSTSDKKPYRLVGCLWTSSNYSIRGQHGHQVLDGDRRLLEWLEFHLLAGFDHLYVYDNSGAHGEESALKRITDVFGDRVTHINWPSKICNNMKPANRDPGERSSQYAAETSCLKRYGHTTEWMASFDVDEYMVPQGDTNSLKEMLDNADKDGSKILSFKSYRAKLRADTCEQYINDEANCPAEPQRNGHNICLIPKTDKTILQSYNCDPTLLPKPPHAERAQKQIYRPDYVYHHFVHYSTVTQDMFESGKSSKPKYERLVDEINEAVMVHSKAVTPQNAIRLDADCSRNQGCNFCIQWPDNIESKDTLTDEGGRLYNGFVNYNIENKWVPRLEDALSKRIRANPQLMSINPWKAKTKMPEVVAEVRL